MSLGVQKVIVFGWSSGGHVAIEIIPFLEEAEKEDGRRRRRQASSSSAAVAAAAVSVETRCLGIMITSTPPCKGTEQLAQAYNVSGTAQVEDALEAGKEVEQKRAPECDTEEGKVGLSVREVWSDDEAVTYASMVYGQPFEDWMVQTARRTDGRARRIMFTALAGGQGADQRKVLETSNVLCAVVNGAKEPFVNLDYLDGIKYKNLWEEKCHRIPGLGHAPFWEKPDLFHSIFFSIVR